MLDVAIDNLIDNVEDFKYWDFNAEGFWEEDVYCLPLDLNFDKAMIVKDERFYSVDVGEVTDMDGFRRYWCTVGDIADGLAMMLMLKIRQVEYGYGLECVGFSGEDDYSMMDRIYLKFRER